MRTILLLAITVSLSGCAESADRLALYAGCAYGPNCVATVRPLPGRVGNVDVITPDNAITYTLVQYGQDQAIALAARRF